MGDLKIQSAETKQTDLSQVHCGPRVQTLFVTIPGAGITPPDQWSDNNGDIWPKSMGSASTPDIGIFFFPNTLATDERPFSWTQVEADGADFLGALYRLVQINELNNCPIVLIAHSTGGIILKRALCIAHRDPQRFRILLRNIAGIILLACPHAVTGSVDAWSNISTIFRTFSGSKSKHVITRQAAAGLSGDCLSFEQAMDQTPVLSIYETIKTRTRGVFGSKVILVDQSFAKTNTRLERMVPSKAEHANVCYVTASSEEWAAIMSFIDSAAKNTHEIIKKKSQEYVRPIGLGQSTVQSKSSAGSLSKTKISFTGTGSSAHGQLSVDPKLPCFVMPFNRNRDFSGRTKILDDLDKSLSPTGEHSSVSDGSESGSHLQTFALCGPGGMGKTQLAIEFVYRIRDQFDAIVWLQADEPAKLAQGFSHVAVTLGLVESDSPESRDQIMIRDSVLGWLANPMKSYKQLDAKSEEATWLLIFDNVDNPDILDNYWPADSSGSILITSRDPLVKSYVYSLRRGMSLPPLEVGEAVKLLLKLTGRRKLSVEEQNAAILVADILGGLPLAITQMAGVIARRELTFSEFLGFYKKESAHADLFNLQLGPAKARAGYEHTIASVWALENIANGQVLLEALSVLDPDGIPEYILEDNPAVSVWPAYPATSVEYQQARTELLQRSLITRQKDEKKLVIHRLIQDATRAKMSDEEFDTVFSSMLSFVSAVWPYEDFNFGNEIYRWKRCDELYPHILKMQSLFPRFRPPTRLSAAHLAGPKLFIDTASNTTMRGRCDETIPLLYLAELMCDALEKESPRDASTQDLYDQLVILRRTMTYERGVQALHTNEPEISLINMKAFNKAVRESYGDLIPRGKDQTLGVSWNELGNAFLQNNDGLEAEKCYLESKKCFAALEGATRISISMPLISLGFASWIQGRLGEADELFCQALKDRENEYGIDDKVSFVTGKLLLGYGNVKLAQGHLEESFFLHQRCLQQYRSTLGNNHHRTADGCVKVASHYIRLEIYESARALLDQALKVYTADDRPYFISEHTRARRNRGLLLQLLGKEEEAREDLGIARKLWRRMCPDDPRKFEDLVDEDFDSHIMFWSR